MGADRTMLLVSRDRRGGSGSPGSLPVRQEGRRGDGVSQRTLVHLYPAVPIAASLPQWSVPFVFAGDSGCWQTCWEPLLLPVAPHPDAACGQEIQSGGHSPRWLLWGCGRVSVCQPQAFPLEWSGRHCRRSGVWVAAGVGEVPELTEQGELAGAGVQGRRYGWACCDGKGSRGIGNAWQEGALQAKMPNLSCHRDKIMNGWDLGLVKQEWSGKPVTSCLLLSPTGVKSMLSWGTIDLSMYLRVSWIHGPVRRWLTRVVASCGCGFSPHSHSHRGAELSLLRVSSEFWCIIACNSHLGSGKLNRGLVYFTLLIFSPQGKQPGLGFSLVAVWANDAKEHRLICAVLLSPVIVSGYYSLARNVNEVP